ncbi:hydrogenase [Planktothrix agardhii]|uniref:hydrogenase n=1 Tax=Planktothrix agardhii TaxID=1160 RepID=UPI0004155818|nr:hydrogenase [Planktothrix agardhii]
MEQTQEILKQQLSALSQRYPDLGNRLAETAQKLKTAGTPATKTLVDELIAYSQDFSNIQQKLLTQGQPTASQATSVQQLENLLLNLKPAPTHQKTHQQALQILEQVLSLTHNEQKDFPPLQTAQNQARELQTAISQQTNQLHSGAEALATGNHPLVALVNLVEKQESLDDNQWAILEEQITSAFGKSLGVAISRGKINFTVKTPVVSAVAAPKPAIPDIVILDEPQGSRGPELIIVPSIDVTKLPPTIDGKNIFFGNAPLVGKTQEKASLSNINLKILVHLQGLGDRTFAAREYAGTRGQGRRLEAFQINIDPAIAGLSLRYMAHIAAIGDTPLTPEGELVGERGKNRQIEGLAIELIGPQAPNYKVFYTAHIQNKGDVPVCTNGEYCGTKGQGLRIEGMKIWIEAK